MKLLYFAPYRENSGWGVSSREIMRALISVGVDVVARPLLHQDRVVLPDLLQMCEEKSAVGCTHLLQHCHPHYMTASTRFKKNVGFTLWESLCSDKMNAYIHMLERMDDIICPTIPGDVRLRFHKIGIPTDINKFTKQYDRPKFLEDNIPTFYSIVDNTKRKNIMKTVLAFYHATQNRPCQLVLKTNNTKEFPDFAAYIQQYCAGMSIRQKYNKHIVITDRLTDDEICGLHQHGDTYITTSHGEGWCLPAFDACGFGSKLIAPKMEPFVDFAQTEKFLYEYSLEIQYGSDYKLYPTAYTSNDYWVHPALNDVVRKITYALDTPKIDRADYTKYSYEAIGEKILNVLTN